ncbi:HEAT repeat domain-containing protein [Thalassiella azotivora]
MDLDELSQRLERQGCVVPDWGVTPAVFPGCAAAHQLVRQWWRAITPLEHRLWVAWYAGIRPVGPAVLYDDFLAEASELYDRLTSSGVGRSYGDPVALGFGTFLPQLVERRPRPEHWAAVRPWLEDEGLSSAHHPEDLRAFWVTVAARSGAPEAPPVIAELLVSTPALRWVALEGLGLSRSREHRALVQAYAHDPDADIRRVAKAAIRRLTS